MGVFEWPLQVSSLDGERSLGIEAMVDTGASYTVLPAGLLDQLGVERTRKLTFELADGRRQVLDVGRARVTVDGATEVTPVVFGTDGTDALLGAVTLQELALVVDSSRERLLPAETLRY
ncbi:MAG: retroviral-like aspartic protease family protein [bacterium]|nr:retroviral-like aspartic protease family protein [bacterium]MDE0287319.1 retroviral-like aspartic protease family protein [bacterium]MDE0439138.1 retroviral-like aspartic protease family protein [bacterium]